MAAPFIEAERDIHASEKGLMGGDIQIILYNLGQYNEDIESISLSPKEARVFAGKIIQLCDAANPKE